MEDAVAVKSVRQSVDRDFDVAEPEIAHRAGQQPVGSAAAQGGMKGTHRGRRHTLAMAPAGAQGRAGAALAFHGDARFPPPSAPVRIGLRKPGGHRFDGETDLVEQKGQRMTSNCGIFAAE